MSTGRSKSARWIVLGLAATAAGFLGASLNPGAGPRTVNGSLTLGPFYLPPLLVAVVCVSLATLAACRVRHSVAIGAAFAAVLLIGSATMGSAAISYRISHPAHPLGFIEDWLQLLGEATAALPIAFAATRHRLSGRTHRTTERHLARAPSWTPKESSMGRLPVGGPTAKGIFGTQTEEAAMTRRSSARRATNVFLLISLVLGASVPAIAATTGRAAASSHRLKLTAEFHTLTGLPTGKFTATGTIAGSPFAAGAIVRHVSTLGNTLSVKFTWFATNGSVSGTATEKRTSNPDGSASFAIMKGRITGGGGAYRGATGTFSGTGTNPNLNSPVVEHLSGQVKY